VSQGTDTLNFCLRTLQLLLCHRRASASELPGPPQSLRHADSSDQEPVQVLPQISCAVLDRKVSVCLSFSICKIRMMLHRFTSAAKFLLKKQSVTFG